MKGILYAYNSQTEYIVTRVDLENGVFTGYFRDVAGTKHFIIDGKISNYEFYDSSTKIDEKFDLKKYIKTNSKY